MKAGDLVIWDRLLAHGNGRNAGSRPRLAQVHHHVSGFRKRRAAPGAGRLLARPARTQLLGARRYPSRYRDREQGQTPAELTPLGRKLLGLDRW